MAGRPVSAVASSTPSRVTDGSGHLGFHRDAAVTGHHAGDRAESADKKHQSRAGITLAAAFLPLQQQRDALATNKSQLNLLLARDIHTPFEVQQVGESPITQRTLPELGRSRPWQRRRARQAWTF